MRVKKPVFKANTPRFLWKPAIYEEEAWVYIFRHSNPIFLLRAFKKD